MENLLSKRVFVGPIIAGIVVYSILSLFLIPMTLSLSLSIFIFFISLAFVHYYYYQSDNHSTNPFVLTSSESSTRRLLFIRSSGSSIIFVLLYLFSISVVLFLHQDYDQQIFTDWHNLSFNQLLPLLGSILLSTFMPGYALVSSLIDRKNEQRLVLRFLLGYIISVLLTAILAYSTASLGVPVSQIENIVLGLDISILLFFIFSKKDVWKRNLAGKIESSKEDSFYKFDKRVILVFLCLFFLILVSSYYLYNGTIVADQWGHHGNALRFIDGSFSDIVSSSIDLSYPYFYSSFLSSFFSISETPSANAFASLNFLNIMPVLAFYYFFSVWFPNRRKAAVLASVLFVLSSGFGWVYALHIWTIHGIGSTELETLDILLTAGAKTFDIWVPNTFINVGHPDITTPLIVFGLPCGFVLLGLVKERIENKIKFIAIISLIVLTGYLSHDEFGLFLIVALIVPIIFTISHKSSLYLGILIGLLFVTLVAFLSPGEYYRSRTILGTPFILLYFLFLAVCWTLYFTNALLRIGNVVRKKIFHLFTKLRSSRIGLVLTIGLVSAVVYTYILSIIIWSIQLPEFDIRLNTLDLHIVPWHFYPIRFGLMGILAICCLLSYISKRFEKEIFVFGIIALVAFLLGPLYDEHRFNKYIMVGMVGLSSIFLTDVVLRHLRTRPLVGSLIVGIVFVSCSLSVFLYLGYVSLGLSNNDIIFDYTLGGRRFPQDSDLQLLEFLRDNLNVTSQNVAIPENETTNHAGFLGTKIERLVGVPLPRILQSPSTLQEDSVEGMLTLLNYSHTKLIVIPESYLKRTPSSEALSFARNNFEQVYNDGKTLVFTTTPNLVPPTDESHVSLVMPKKALKFENISSERVLDFDDSSFLEPSNPNIVMGEHRAFLGGEADLWSRLLLSKSDNDSQISYLEGDMRVLENSSGRGTEHHSGIMWVQGDRFYYAIVRSDSISLFTPDRQEFVFAPIVSQEGDWINLKIFLDNRTDKIRIYANDILKIEAPLESGHTSITQAGLRSWNQLTEFSPPKIAEITQLYDLTYLSRSTYNSIMSILSNSNQSYSVFASDDYSLVANHNVILFAQDPDDIGPYLNMMNTSNQTYTIIILGRDESNTDPSYGGFANFLCLNHNGDARISEGGRQGECLKAEQSSYNFSVPELDSKSNSHSAKELRYFYKEYGKSKIYYLMLDENLRSLNGSNNLSSFIKEIAGFQHLDTVDSETDNELELSANPATRFVGKASIPGKGIINTTYINFPEEDDLSIGKLAIDLSSYQVNKTSEDHSKIEKSFEDFNFRDMKIYGPYIATVYFDRFTFIPQQSPYFGYFKIPLRDGFDAQIKLLDGSRVEINNTSNEDESNDISNSYEVREGFIDLFDIRNDESYGLLGRDLPIFANVKSPQIVTNETVKFDELRSNDPYDLSRPWANGVPLMINGTTDLKLAHVASDTMDGSRYITYFKWNEVHVDATHPITPPSHLMDLSDTEVLTSDLNNKALFSVSVVFLAATYLAWTSPKLARIFSVTRYSEDKK